MNITLSADEKLIQKARAYAESQGTTLNDLIRRHLQMLVGEMDRAAIAEEFSRLAHEGGGCSPEGWKFNREEIHDRGHKW